MPAKDHLLQLASQAKLFAFLNPRKLYFNLAVEFDHLGNILVAVFYTIHGTELILSSKILVSICSRLKS